MTVILGGGLSGLSAAFYALKKFGEPPTIYEASCRLGGWIRTERQRDKGFLFESGPRTIRPKGLSGANTLQMIEELKLPVDFIKSNQPAARNRMIYAKGRLCLLPNNFLSLFKTMPPFSKPLINSFFHDLLASRKTIKFKDESIYDFTLRRFGKEVADYAISPMICGICAGDAKEISVRFLLDDMFEKEQEWGGVTKGIILSKMLGKTEQKDTGGVFEEEFSSLYQKAQKQKWSMYRVKNGLETLPQKLSLYLRERDVSIQTVSECHKIQFNNDGETKIFIKNQVIDVAHVISSMPAYKLALCLRSQHPSLSAQLSTIPYVDVAVVNLQYNVPDLLKQRAFGFLVPPVEKLPILGVIFDSCCFDMQGNTVLTVMMGGKWFDEYFGKNPTQKELLDTALICLDKVLGIDHEPRLTRVNVLQKCIPQYMVGHKQRISDIRRYIKHYKLPLTVTGAAFDGVGINDVILSARRQVESIELKKH